MDIIIFSIIVVIIVSAIWSGILGKSKGYQNLGWKLGILGPIGLLIIGLKDNKFEGAKKISNYIGICGSILIFLSILIPIIRSGQDSALQLLSEVQGEWAAYIILAISIVSVILSIIKRKFIYLFVSVISFIYIVTMALYIYNYDMVPAFGLYLIIAGGLLNIINSIIQINESYMHGPGEVKVYSKFKKCTNCKKDFYFGLSSCPHCGGEDFSIHDVDI